MKKISLLLILVVLLIIVTAGCQKQIFDGSYMGNDKQFILDYSVLNKTMTHEMELEQGTFIDVSIQNKSGRVDILITNTDSESIYRGDNAFSSDFSVEIPATGTYIFSVTGSNDAKGSVSFIAKG